MSERLLKKKSISEKMFDKLNIILMVIFSLLVIYPVWQTLLLSFSGADEATTLGFHLWIKEWRLDAYNFLFSYENIVLAYINTIIRTIGGVIAGIVITLLVAYPLSKRDLPYRNIITVFFILSMFFSGGLIPTYILIQKLDLIDNRLVLILPTVVNVFNIVIMRNFLMTIDKAYEESAFIDGAGYGTVLFKIIIPMAKPVIATIALWLAVAHWNAWFDCMIYIRDKKKVVAQFILREMLEAVNFEANDINSYNAGLKQELLLSNVRAAMVLISIGPIILVYPFAQKYFVKGVNIGSLKG